MRICVLNACYERPSALVLDHDPPGDPSPYLPDHHVEVVTLRKATAEHQLGQLARRGHDVFINLCDGAADEERAGIEVVHALERLGVAFTGAGSAFYDPTREAMKEACRGAGIDTPRHCFAHDRAGAERAAEVLRFPLIVKPSNGYSSIGLSPASRVETAADLGARIEEMTREFGGALVEEFIEGREFTILVAEPSDGQAEPRAYQPLEYRFPRGETFKHARLKWVDYEQMSSTPVDDPVLAARLMDISRRKFTALGGSGYGRCDVRMDRSGRLFMLEINPNCGLFLRESCWGGADVILAQDPRGHRGFLEHILRCAERRRRRDAPVTGAVTVASPR
jgi:D-alanine-D-alanine ligase